MRNLIYTINLTLDGCFDHTKMVPEEELFEYYTRLVRDADLLVYGRKTYEIMVPYWPDIANNPSGETKEDVDFARHFSPPTKLFFRER
jgi:dihydrofolate reductase